MGTEPQQLTFEDTDERQQTLFNCSSMSWAESEEIREKLQRAKVDCTHPLVEEDDG